MRGHARQPALPYLAPVTCRSPDNERYANNEGATGAPTLRIKPFSSEEWDGEGQVRGVQPADDRETTF